MTEWTIALRLMRDRHRRNFCLPNYTPPKWWECDMFELTKAGFFNEYEIKLTRSDFKADARKTLENFNWATQTSTQRNKHQEIAQPHGPRRFWYVTPEGLIQAAELPSWAGLITVRDRGEAIPAYRRYVETEVVRAPVLHCAKCEEKTVEHARGICYWRLQNLYHRQNANVKPDMEERTFDLSALDAADVSDASGGQSVHATRLPASVD